MVLRGRKGGAESASTAERREAFRLFYSALPSVGARPAPCLGGVVDEHGAEVADLRGLLLPEAVGVQVGHRLELETKYRAGGGKAKRRAAA